MIIKYLVMDVDGTLTDGKIYMSNSGELFKAFDIKDGCGIKDIAISAGIVPVIITARQSDIVLNRCKELGITEVYQGVRDKFGKLKEITNDLSRVAYIGDDILDLQCMLPVSEAGGLVGCPADAVDKVKKVADFVSSKNGGDGAVRDLIEWIVERREYSVTYQERYAAIIKRTQKPENKNLYNQINVMTQDGKQERLMRLLWRFHPDGVLGQSSVDGVSVRDMDPKIAHYRLDEIEKLLDELGWQ